MDFQSAMETFAEAWMAANTKARAESSSDPQREGSAERTNGRAEDEVTSREQNAHLTNGNSPNRQSPVLLGRDPDDSPKPLSIGKNIPLHVVIETVPLCGVGVGMGVEELRGRVEVDSYALIPGHTRFTDLLQAALMKLGYSEELAQARGLLQLRNWRPLPLEHIPETEDKTVAEVLCDVAPLATLHVRIYSSPWKVRCARDIKDRLLRLLLQQSHHLLVSAGCPLDESLLSALIRGSGEVSEESARQFEAWWAVHVAHVSRPPPTPHVLPLSHHIHPRPHPIEKMPNEPLHPAIQQTVSSQYCPQKTRMRTSFDPELELPRLHRWFAENQHPTRLQIQQYVAELNALESRRGRKPLDVSNVVYWFKNARAAYKRQEYRAINGLKSPPPDETSISDNEDHHDHYSTPPAPHVPHSLPHSPPTPHDHSHLQLQQQQQREQQEQQRQQHDENPDDDEVRPPRSESSEILQGRSQPAGGSSEGGPNSAGERCNAESDVDMSEDDDDVRSRDSVSVTVEGKCSPPPAVSPGSLSLPPYPPLPGLGQAGMDRLPYPVVPGSLLQHSMMYMAHYMPQVSPFSSGLGSGGIPEERRKRNRTFIDPVTEVPRLEQWFAINTHPSHNLILKYTEELNRMPYRQKFPKLEPKNVQFWFKNRRAKCKRLRVSM